MTEKETDWQQLMDGLTAALEALNRCQPHLNADDLERICLARHFIRRVLLSMARQESVALSRAERLHAKGYQFVPDAALRAAMGGSVSLDTEDDA